MDTVTVAQAAAALGIAPRTVQDRIKRGEIPAVRVSARLYMIPRTALAKVEPGKRSAGRKPRAEVERQRAQGPLKRGRKGTA